MAFIQADLVKIENIGQRMAFTSYNYKTVDLAAEVLTVGYFQRNPRFTLFEKDVIYVQAGDRYIVGSVLADGLSVVDVTDGVEGIQNPSRTITFSDSPYQITTADYYLWVDATSGPIRIDLLTAVGNEGREHNIKKIDSSANEVSIVPPPPELIENEISAEITDQGASITTASDNTEWWIK